MRLPGADYARRHWRGEFSLARSFWGHLVLPFAALGALERFMFPPYIRGQWAVTVAVVGFFVIARLIIYPWQVVGVIRACEGGMRSYTDRTWAIAAQGVVVLSLAATLAGGFSTWQRWWEYTRDDPPRTAAPGYSLALIADGALLHVRGTLEVGITAAVAGVLAAQPRIRGMVLDSSGGQIYEGRGLARLIRERRLNTYTLDRCLSSCTTAFAAGVTRTLGGGARLGFHRYRYLGGAALPVIDVAAEQAKDAALFRGQGIAAGFVDKIFAQPPHGMWWPEEEELVRAGVVHHTGFALPRSGE